MRATQHFNHGLLLSTPKEKEKKQNYLHRKAPNKQKKNEKSFWNFFLITTASMEIKLIKSYNYFFWFLLRFIKHTRRKHKKGNKLAWMIQ